MADGNFALPPEITAELKKMTDEARNALTALSEVKDDNTATKMKLEKWFATYEEHNAAHARKYAQYQKEIEDRKTAETALEKKLSEGGAITADLQKRIDSLVIGLSQKGGGGAADPRDNQIYKDCFRYLTTKEAGWRPTGGHWAFRPDVPDEIKTLRTDNESQGGYLIPQVMDTEIRKNITEMSPVRLFARTRIAPNKTMDVPRRHTIPVATFEGEGDAASNSQSTYGSEQITLYRQTVKIPATLDMMVSSAFNLEQEIASDVGEAFGKGEGTNFVKGTGQTRPKGFVMDDRCEVVQTASSGTLIWDDMIEIAGKLKRGQNPWYYLNRRTLAYLQKSKSTIGVPIWQPVAGNTPATIWGFPYNSDFIDLDDAQSGSNAKPVVFADLRRGYEIYDMLGISVVRDDITLAANAITQWIFRRYLTGQVVIPEAIKVLKIQ